ncbi:MAG: hydroxylase [Actinobacteria bacterium]|nr:hydroxylase [Actinomycetota bacterium]MDA9890908.1 ferritin-like domain-containing protein [Actinomycetota bacterium]
MTQESIDHDLDDDPQYRAAVIDLLAVLAVSELTAFERMAADSVLAPTFADKASIGELATAEFRHFMALRNRLVELGADPEMAMEPFRQTLEDFHMKTKPTDWLEGLMKAFVGDGIGLDFYREISSYVDPKTRELVHEVCDDLSQAAYVVERIRTAIEEDPKVAGRLALWGRRLVGEALSQAQRVAAERDALAALIIGGVDRPGADLAEIGRMLARLTDNHSRRMADLGLAA